MVDIHSHIIWGIDDGARSIEEAIKLIREAHSQGVNAIFATPHYNPAGSPKAEQIRERASDLNKRLKDEGLDIIIYTGNEVMYFEDIISHLRDGKILGLADSDYVLIEFYPDDEYRNIVKAVRSMVNAGYCPVIAHAERYKSLYEYGLDELISMGAYIQLSTEPLQGGIFRKDSTFIKKQLKKGNVHFMGSDMHNMDKRPPKNAKAIRWIKNNIENADDILEENVRFIIDNEIL
ncbi:MAG: protein tyrosine phosphatase [Eubacteriales bacterium]|nr:protein tyrosine phosphatase [Eubacteriales bacterium]